MLHGDGTVTAAAVNTVVSDRVLWSIEDEDTIEVDLGQDVPWRFYSRYVYPDDQRPHCRRLKEEKGTT